MPKVTVNYSVMRPAQSVKVEPGSQKRVGRPSAYASAGKMTVHKALWIHEVLDKQLRTEAKSLGVNLNDLWRKKLSVKIKLDSK